MTREERRAKECAQHRERYYWYKAHGICVSCGQADAAPGKVKCEECAAKVADRSMAAYYRKREERKEAMRRWQRERYAKRRTEGLCTDCGKKRLQENGFVWIVFCDDAVMTNGTSMHIAA